MLDESRDCHVIVTCLQPLNPTSPVCLLVIIEPPKKTRMPKVAEVKNKMPADVKITAEQLLQEANSQKIERVARRPRQKVADPEELAQLRLTRRKGFEDNIRKNRTVMSNWIKYVEWEQTQQEYEQSMSVLLTLIIVVLHYGSSTLRWK